MYNENGINDSQTDKRLLWSVESIDIDIKVYISMVESQLNLLQRGPKTGILYRA
jgi:hypothetical protein